MKGFHALKQECMKMGYYVKFKTGWNL